MEDKVQIAKSESPSSNPSNGFRLVKTNFDLKTLIFVVCLVFFALAVTLNIQNRLYKQSSPSIVRPEISKEITTTEVKMPVTVPSEWPEAVPLTKDASVTNVVEDFGVAASTLTYSTKQTPEEVMAYYTIDLEKKGGVVAERLKTESKEILLGTTANGMNYVVYAGIIGNETVVTVNVEPAQ